MRTTCSRCRGLAATWMTFDYAARVVWLENADTSTNAHGYMLCADHADRLTPPLGWTLSDRRTVTPLFSASVA